MQQIYEGKEVYGHQLTAHVDKKVLLKAFQELAQNLTQEDLKKPINLSKKKQNNIFIKSTETILNLFLSQKLRQLFC